MHISCKDSLVLVWLFFCININPFTEVLLRPIDLFYRRSFSGFYLSKTFIAGYRHMYGRINVFIMIIIFCFLVLLVVPLGWTRIGAQRSILAVSLSFSLSLSPFLFDDYRLKRKLQIQKTKRNISATHTHAAKAHSDCFLFIYLFMITIRFLYRIHTDPLLCPSLPLLLLHLFSTTYKPSTPITGLLSQPGPKKK